MPEPWPSRFAAAMRDEVRHARLCVTVGARLHAPPPRYDARPVRARLAGLPDPLTRAALREILGDEVRHQRLGWTGFGSLWPVLADPLRVALQREASRGLAACEQQTAGPAMRWLESRRPFDPACAALGVLHPEARVEAFYAAVEKLVLPRLTRVGLDGPVAWKNRYRPAGGRS